MPLAPQASGAAASDPKAAASLWANYPGDLSAYMAYFLRGMYIQRVRSLIDPNWVQMSEAELTAHLQSKLSAAEIEAEFASLSAKRTTIKGGVRGYGYLNAIAIAIPAANPPPGRLCPRNSRKKAKTAIAANMPRMRKLGTRTSSAAARPPCARCGDGGSMLSRAGLNRRSSE